MLKSKTGIGSGPLWDQLWVPMGKFETGIHSVNSGKTGIALTSPGLNWDLIAGSVINNI